MTEPQKAERDAHFKRIMGALDMPPDGSPDYDEWLFNAAFEAGRSAGEWISVEERLPEIGEMVLVYRKPYKVVDVTIGGHVEISNNVHADSVFTLHFSHWQPLPAPPKEHS